MLPDLPGHSLGTVATEDHGRAGLPAPDLAEHYEVARMTARRAVRELTERGLVQVIVGKGTFVLESGQTQ